MPAEGLAMDFSLLNLPKYADGTDNVQPVNRFAPKTLASIAPIPAAANNVRANALASSQTAATVQGTGAPTPVTVAPSQGQAPTAPTAPAGGYEPGGGKEGQAMDTHGMQLMGVHELSSGGPSLMEAHMALQAMQPRVDPIQRAQFNLLNNAELEKNADIEMEAAKTAGDPARLQAATTAQAYWKTGGGAANNALNRQITGANILQQVIASGMMRNLGLGQPTQ